MLIYSAEYLNNFHCDKLWADFSQCSADLNENTSNDSDSEIDMFTAIPGAPHIPMASIPLTEAYLVDESSTGETIVYYKGGLSINEITFERQRMIDAQNVLKILQKYCSNNND
jgi:hypothetical protein